MPIYEYRCLECGRLFQRLQSMGASNDGVCCPQCDAENVERQLSTFSSSTSGEATSGFGSPPAGCAHAGGGG